MGELIPLASPTGQVVNLDACQDDDEPVDTEFFDEQLEVLLNMHKNDSWEDIMAAMAQRRATLNDDDSHWLIMSGLLSTAIVWLRDL